MEAMRVVIAQYEGIDATPVLPLAAGCLIAAARVDPALAAVEFSIVIERRPLAQAVAELGHPTILGLSLYPWNAAYSLAVAQAARTAHPDCLIVVGGPSVPRRDERVRRFLADNPAVDVLAFGEGEITFRELLRTHLAGDTFHHIPGIAFRDHITAPPGRVNDFTLTASPYLDGTFDALIARHRHRFTMALCETNRGCPFSCTFCDWSLTKKVVEFPLARVFAELDWVVAHGFSHIMLADANFGIRPRDTGIARRLVELRQSTGLPATFYFYLTKNNHGRNLETIEILQAGGIGTWVGLAVQDFDDDVLEAVKRDNIQTGEAMKLRAICGERGIPTFNELILGLPGQTYQSFARTIATAMPPLPRHDFVLFLCRLIDNTELGDPESRERFGIQTRRCQWKTSTAGWDPIIDEYQEVVVGTRDMPLADWRRAYRLSFFAAALYNLRLLRVVLQHVVDATATPLESFLERLSDGMDDAPPGSVYADLNQTVHRYTNSLLAGGPFVLPFADSASDAPIPVDEAIALIALRRYDEFLQETAALIPADAEAFRYQSLITPRWQRPEPIDQNFSLDWPTYAATGVQHPRQTQVRFTPSSFVALPKFRDFASTHFAYIRTRLDVGRVETLNHPPPTAPHFIVLPATAIVLLTILLLPLATLGQTRPPLTPQAQRGQVLFQKSPKGVACGACHSLGNIGTVVGPDLTQLAAAAPPRALVMAMEITETAYVQQVKTTKGEFPGIQKQKIGDTLEIWDLSKLPPNLRTFAAADIQNMKPSEKWVHPPAAAHYNNQESADIIGFLKFVATGLQKEVTPGELEDHK